MSNPGFSVNLVSKNATRNMSMRLYRSVWIFGVVLVGMIILLAPMPVFAQSCALCYTQAASSGSRMIQALKSGILILIAPPTLMSLGLVVVCYRRRNHTRDTRDGEFDSDWKRDASLDGSSEKRDR